MAACGGRSRVPEQPYDEGIKMNIVRALTCAILALSLTGCAGLWEEEDVEISAVPAAAINAAKGAVPGLEIRSAEVETKDGRTIYEIDGKADGVKHEVKVTAGGEVLKVETDD